MSILGLDIGGANIKAATPDGRAWNEPFALWKNPQGLSAVLREILYRFPDTHELAITMTGELCDCFETKRQGVASILDSIKNVSQNRDVKIWTTEGKFISHEEAYEKYLAVAAANWHGLATFACRFTNQKKSLLIDIGTTTTDIIPLADGLPASTGLTDFDRLRSYELVYTGVRRTPVCALSGERTAAEFFATMHDVYLVLGLATEDKTDTETADNRPATTENALSRLARMLGGDRETLSDDDIIQFAIKCYQKQLTMITYAIRFVRDTHDGELEKVVVSGSGEFLAKRALMEAFPEFVKSKMLSLTQELGDRLSTCAPAYAVAVLASQNQR